MDHAYVEEHQIADRYVMGNLPAAEAERFEDHYLSCPECLDRLELAESVQRGFRRMAGQEVAKLTAARQLAVVAWLARLGRGRQAGVLLSALLLAVALPTGLALRERLQASQPQSNVAILFLDAERGPESPESEPAQSLRQPTAGGWIVLTSTVDPPYLPSYRVVLRDGRGREISRVEGLHADENGALNLSLPARLVPPGDYSLAIESLTSGGKTTPAGRFTFRVLPPA